MKTVLLFLWMLPFSVFSQKNKLTDTTIVTASVKENCYVGRSLDEYCIKKGDQPIEAGSVVIICGVKRCEYELAKTFTDFVEVIFNRDTYFIEPEKLHIANNFTFDDFLALSYEQALAFKNFAQSTSELVYLEQLKDEWKKVIKFLENCKPAGLTILDYSVVDESEYTEGTGVTVKVYNPTIKTVKYLWFTFTGLNPVGDEVWDRKRKSSKITVRAVGPIKPDASGTYNFSYVWFTDLVETVKISSIKVQYMDGSFKTITNAKSITLDSKSYDLLLQHEQ
jgi:hypothetical protein